MKKPGSSKSPATMPQMTMIDGKGGSQLPDRKALMTLAKSKTKSINDYSKAGPSINDYPSQDS